MRRRPGIAHLARRHPGAVLVPLAIEYPFWNERKPEALVRFGAPIEAGGDRGIAAWTELLEAELGRTMDALAADSLTRNPALFESLVRGRGGVGGIYDVWRRARGLLGGQRVRLSHED